jgi:hypothetical protein
MEEHEVRRRNVGEVGGGRGGGEGDGGDMEDYIAIGDISDNSALSGYTINDLISFRQILNMTYPYKNDEEDLEYTYGERGLLNIMRKEKGQYAYKNPKIRIFSPEHVGE